MNTLKVAKGQRRQDLINSGRVPGGALSQKKLAELELTDGFAPKHTPAYQEISGVIPGFQWESGVGGNGSRFVRFDGYPNVNGKFPSLADLVLYSRGELSLNFDVFDGKTSHLVQPLVNLGPVGQEFAQLFLQMGISLPPDPKFVEPIADWLGKAISGETCTVFSGVCPDYAVDSEGRYTFSSLGNGVGLVAQRAKRVIPPLAAFFRRHNLDVRFTIAIGDFEADSESTCARVGLTRDDFRSRLRESQQAFRVGLDSQITLDTPFVTEIGGWDSAYLRCTNLAQEGQLTGTYPLSEAEFAKICEARRSLYERWYGEGCDVRSILIQQAPEYGAMGTIAERYLPNTLILGADAPAMAIFWQGGADRIRPVIYLRNVNY